MAKKQLVLAFYENETAANVAVNKIEQWAKTNKKIKLGGIGVLVKDDQEKIKTHKQGSRKIGTGVVVGVIVGILTSGVSVVGGAIGGGIIGAFFRTGPGLSKRVRTRIDDELDRGKAAVCILAKSKDAARVSAKLVELGGQPQLASG